MTTPPTSGSDRMNENGQSDYAGVPEYPGLVSGHALYREGAPTGGEERYWTTSGPGCGRCSCGQYSPHLPSTTARKRWHRRHKNTVREVDPS